MNCTFAEAETSLLESDAGNAVYDALIQSNIDPRKASVELVKRLLLAELRFRQTLERYSE